MNFVGQCIQRDIVFTARYELCVHIVQFDLGIPMATVTVVQLFGRWIQYGLNRVPYIFQISSSQISIPVA